MNRPKETFFSNFRQSSGFHLAGLLLWKKVPTIINEKGSNETFWCARSWVRFTFQVWHLQLSDYNSTLCCVQLGKCRNSSQGDRIAVQMQQSGAMWADRSTNQLQKGDSDVKLLSLVQPPPPFENNNRNVCLLEWIIRSRQPTALSVPPHLTRRMLMAEMPRRSRHRVFQGIIQFPCWRKGWNVERMLWCTGLMSLREPTRALSYDQPVWRVQKWVALFWVITRMRFLFP